MIEFKKYSSIENHFYKDYLDQVREQVPADMQWVVQEKVHGTNTSFLCDGNDVKFAKRTSILEDDEKFYDYQELVDEYRERVLSLFNRLKQDCPDMQSVSVFGELFGGYYLPVDHSKELTENIDAVASYVNENRLANVVSHTGEVHMPSDLGKLIKEMSCDVVEDFLKEHSALYNVINKSEIKIFNKELNKMISSLVKKVYVYV